MAVRYLSLLDLLEFKESKDIVLSGDVNKLTKLLYDCGFDVYGFGIAYQICEHRPLSWSKNGNNNTAYTMRFLSMERCDIEWQQSGYMSEEKKHEILYLKDPELQRDLEMMSRRANPTLAIIQSMEENWGWLRDEEQNDESDEEGNIESD